MGRPEGRWLFVVHGALGLAILGVLALKLRRVTPLLLTPKGRRLSALVGILTTVAALTTIGLGVWWVVVQRPVNYPNGMILHTTAGFILLGLSLWHLLLRYRPPKGRDVRDRRSLLRLAGMLAGGAIVWGGLEAGQKVVDTPGASRRFTGSRLQEGVIPVTMWLLDRPKQIDINRYVLAVGGAVEAPLRFNFSELSQLPQSTLKATIDCTGGWYSEQEWQGIAVAELLTRAQPLAGAAYVRFRSVTGYRWSLPLDEAMHTLLATAMAGETLSHGHGAPLRLVAPGRRGFQWVKWVVAVDILSAPDIGQWAAIFASGLNGV
jgi:hypothetical protein